MDSVPRAASAVDSVVAFVLPDRPLRAAWDGHRLIIRYQLDGWDGDIGLSNTFDPNVKKRIRGEYA